MRGAALLLVLLTAACASAPYVVRAHPTPAEIDALLQLPVATKKAATVLAPFALSVSSGLHPVHVVMPGAAVVVRCFVPESYGAGRIRYGIEGLRMSEHPINHSENRLLIERLMCGRHIATCTVHTRAGLERREFLIETTNADDCQGAP